MEKCNLKLDNLVFDKISFQREGLKNSNEPTFQLEATTSQNQDNKQEYRIQLELKGTKKDEFVIQIVLLGFFTIDSDIKDKELEEKLINQNAVAIMMPYLRSEVSLITAQPNIDCVVLPPVNVADMFNNSER